MKINCLSCGHNIDLDDAYAENYEGPIKCFGCGATLEIRTEQSAVRYVHVDSSRARNHRDRNHGRPAASSLQHSQGKSA